MAEIVSSPILICGMHRSHTSVFTQWLHTCGLHVGDRLAGASTENPSGYWEDLDFVELHEDILAHNGLDAMSINPTSFEITGDHRSRASTLLRRKSETTLNWGWKDPRTCMLYESLWSQILSDHFVIGVYRPYTEVVTSLMLRMLNDQLESSHYKSLVNKFSFLSRKVWTPALRKLAEESQLHDHFLQVWISHNKALIRILERLGSGRALLISPGDNLPEKALLDFMKQHWDVQLEFKPIHEIWRTRNRAGEVVFEFNKEILDEARLTNATLKKLLEASNKRMRTRYE